MGKTILTAKHITKLFPGMKALDNVDFDLREGEVHILVGENGAGKSTLAKVILGAYKAEEGEITFDNEVVKFNGTKDALAKGIRSYDENKDKADTYEIMTQYNELEAKLAEALYNEFGVTETQIRDIINNSKNQEEYTAKLQAIIDSWQQKNREDVR